MHSTDGREKKQLLEWAQRQGQNTFESDDNRESYFIERNTDNTYIIEYDFSTIADLKALMDTISGAKIPDEIKHMLAVAAFRAKPEMSDLQQTISNEQKNIPEFIYAF